MDEFGALLVHVTVLVVDTVSWWRSSIELMEAD